MNAGNHHFNKYRLGANIALIMVALCAMHIGITFVLRMLSPNTIVLNEWYIQTIVLLHIAVGLNLWFRFDLFARPSSSTPQHSVGIANTISLFRITSIPTVAVLVINAGVASLRTITILLLSIIFLTDLIDGWLARTTKSTTKIGRYLDSWSDYLLLITITTVLREQGLISQAYLIILNIRLVFPLVSVFLLYFYVKEDLYYRSWIGQASVFAIMFYTIVTILFALFTITPFDSIIRTVLELIALLFFIIPSIIHWSVNIFTLITTKHKTKLPSFNVQLFHMLRFILCAIRDFTRFLYQLIANRSSKE